VKFPEDIFLYALTTREEDARKFSSIFRPEWLHKVEYVALLHEIYGFLKKHDTVPSVEALHQIFEDKDPIAYNSRFKPALNEIKQATPDLSQMVYVLDNARNVAIVRSLKELSDDSSFDNLQKEFKGDEILSSLAGWMNHFQGADDKKTVNLKDAVEELVENRGFNSESNRVPCGIDPLDKWSNGGLRPKNIGVLMAPTGHGKSVCLLIMAHKMAAIEKKKVWLVSNELSWEEVTERLLTRLSGVPLNDIMEHPAAGYTGLNHVWGKKLHERLLITDYYGPDICANDLEADMLRHVSLHGWKPEVIILDFMERMRPNEKGIGAREEWIKFGHVAKDLVRLAKKHNLIIWTACQTNRGGLNADIIELSHGQGSIRHFQEAAAVVAMRKIPLGGENLFGMQFFNEKQRHAEGGNKPITLLCNLAKMDITKKEVEPPPPPSDDDDDDDDGYKRKPKTPRQRQKDKAKWRK
jgi:hypothetical protein